MSSQDLLISCQNGLRVARVHERAPHQHSTATSMLASGHLYLVEQQGISLQLLTSSKRHMLEQTHGRLHRLKEPPQPEKTKNTAKLYGGFSAGGRQIKWRWTPRTLHSPSCHQEKLGSLKTSKRCHQRQVHAHASSSELHKRIDI